jgi:hypothetical protein
MKQGSKHYLKKDKKKSDVVALTPQQRGAKTRAANKAKLAEEANAEDTQSATG